MFSRARPPQQKSNHFVGTHKCRLMDLKTPLEHTFQSPIFTRASPLQHKQPLCMNTQPLCGLLNLKTPQEINFHSLMFSRARPPQHKQPLCGHSQPLCTLLGSNFQDPMFIRGSPYKTIHITTVWVHTTTLQHKQLLCKHTQPLCGLLDLKTQL